MRLIDADELINDINNGLWDWDELQNISGIAVLKQTITDIQNTKTVDAVPVIRCKDCRRSGTGDCPMHIIGAPADESVLKRFDDDFCSYGESK